MFIQQVHTIHNHQESLKSQIKIATYMYIEYRDNNKLENKNKDNCNKERKNNKKKHRYRYR